MRQLAADVIDVVTKYIPTTGVALTAYNPISEFHSTLCSTGFDVSVTDFLTSPRFLQDDVGYKVLINRPSMYAICWWEIEGDYGQTPSAVEVFKPSGILGGASVRLTTPDGRYTGDLHIGTTDASFPDVHSMTALRQAARLLAIATDVSRRLEQLLTDPSLVDCDKPAAVVGFHGQVFRLPGRRVPTLLADDPSVAESIAAWRTTSRRALATFLHFDNERWWHIRLVPVSAGTITEASLCSPPYGLTARGAEILTLISQGLHNVAIARRLKISERTCAHHVEIVMSKLGACSRTAAAAMAIEEGLRVLPRF
jgi:DNA-binding CsgD family transcriptional regulator